MLVATFGFCSEARSSDLLRNNGFENGTAGWRAQRGRILHVTPGLQSNGAARLSVRRQVRSSAIRQRSIRRTGSGARYVSTVWVRTRANESVCVRVRERRVALPRGASRRCGRANGHWQKLSVRYSALRDDRFLVVSVEARRPARSSPLRVDQVRLKKVKTTAASSGSDSGSGGGTIAPDSGWRMFSDLSPWNASLDKAPVDPNSSTMITKMVSDGVPGVATQTVLKNWGFPLYFGTATDPLYTLDITENLPFENEIDGTQIHIPDAAIPSAGTDAVMRVLDQTNGFSYHLQRVVIDRTTRTVTAWRSFRLNYSGIGFHQPNEPPTGLGPIRPEELAAGYVNHTMMLSARCLSGHNVPPYDESVTQGKTCAGDIDPAATRLSMGNVVFLDMTAAEIDALPVSIWEKAILRGLAEHGAVVAFNGGAAWHLQFENPLDRTVFGHPDPYAAAGLPSILDYSHTLDSVGGWGAKLKVLVPFARPCSGVCP